MTVDGGSTGSREGRVLDVPAFLRLFQLRGPQIMWFLGAGCSRAAGVKTAEDMIWDFKQRIYRSETNLPPSAITDIGEPAVRRKLQAHFDTRGAYPPGGSEGEYSAYFEASYHDARDRRAYLEEQVGRGKPSFGHLALALLMREDLCRIVWSTNFDRNVEDAAAKVLGSTGRLVVADLGDPARFARALAEGRWPVYGKLHGDYHSQALKNTTEELRSQDEEMRRNLVESCRRNGLAVIGYSGRDASVMAALAEAVEEGRGFPGGLFWFKRSGEEPFSAVTDLIDGAAGQGIDAHLVEVETFDELFVDLARYLPQTAEEVHRLDGSVRPRRRSSTPRASVRSTPAIRTNALPVVAKPAICRLVDCEIGGYREVQEAIAAAGVDVVARRIPQGVAAFGRDGDVRKAFDPFGIRSFDTHPVSSARLGRETGELDLVREALFRSIGGRDAVDLERRGRSWFLVPDAGKVEARIFNAPRTATLDRVAGVVPRTTVRWKEGCGLRLDHRLERLWLLLQPTILVEWPEDAPEAVFEATKEFVRERQALRRNAAANGLLDGWISLVCGDEAQVRLRTFGIGDGVDAEFELLRTSGFSGAAGR